MEPALPSWCTWKLPPANIFDLLPRELQLVVFRELTTHDFAHARRVCRSWAAQIPIIASDRCTRLKIIGSHSVGDYFSEEPELASPDALATAGNTFLLDGTRVPPYRPYGSFPPPYSEDGGAFLAEAFPIVKELTVHLAEDEPRAVPSLDLAGLLPLWAPTLAHLTLYLRPFHMSEEYFWHEAYYDHQATRLRRLWSSLGSLSNLKSLHLYNLYEADFALPRMPDLTLPVLQHLEELTLDCGENLDTFHRLVDQTGPELRRLTASFLPDGKTPWTFANTTANLTHFKLLWRFRRPNDGRQHQLLLPRLAQHKALTHLDLSDSALSVPIVREYCRTIYSTVCELPRLRWLSTSALFWDDLLRALTALPNRYVEMAAAVAEQQRRPPLRPNTTLRELTVVNRVDRRLLYHWGQSWTSRPAMATMAQLLPNLEQLTYCAQAPNQAQQEECRLKEALFRAIVRQYFGAKLQLTIHLIPSPQAKRKRLIEACCRRRNR